MFSFVLINHMSETHWLSNTAGAITGGCIRRKVTRILLFVSLESDEDDADADDDFGSVAYGAMGAPSAPSWTDLLPPSLLGQGEGGEPSTTSPRTSPRKTPVTSPAKPGISSPAASPSKVSKG